MPDGTIYLLDTNAIIEAVRTQTWARVSGGLTIETVRECAEECRRGDRLSSGYVAISDTDFARISAVHDVTDVEIAAVLLRPDSSALDDGERDLFAHALHRPTDDWLLCSPDLASVRFAVSEGIGDNLVSLEQILSAVDARPSSAIRNHFTTDWLVSERTKAKLGIP